MFHRGSQLASPAVLAAAAAHPAVPTVPGTAQTTAWTRADQAPATAAHQPGRVGKVQPTRAQTGALDARRRAGRVVHNWAAARDTLELGLTQAAAVVAYG